MKKHDLLTLICLGIMAFTIKMMVHEGLGHGGAAVLMGCLPKGVSSAWWDGDCSMVSDPVVAVRVVKAGGTLANLVLALGAGLAFFAGRRSPSTGAYFLWLLFVTNTLSGGGYMMVDPIFGFGDWTAFIDSYPDHGSLRWIVVVAGVGLSATGLVLGRRSLRPWLSSDDKERKRQSRLLCLVPYVAGATMVPLSALLNPHGAYFAATSALSTFGGCAWLVWIGLDPVPQDEVRADGEILRHPLWLAGGAISLVLLFAVFGPSISF